MDSGLKLKRVREKLGLRYRQVEQASNLIAKNIVTWTTSLVSVGWRTLRIKALYRACIVSTAFAPSTGWI